MLLTEMMCQARPDLDNMQQLMQTLVGFIVVDLLSKFMLQQTAQKQVTV